LKNLPRSKSEADFDSDQTAGLVFFFFRAGQQPPWFLLLRLISFFFFAQQISAGLFLLLLADQVWNRFLLLLPLIDQWNQSRFFFFFGSES
jgi:hypothetical protein